MLIEKLLFSRRESTPKYHEIIPVAVHCYESEVARERANLCEFAIKVISMWNNSKESFLRARIESSAKKYKIMVKRLLTVISYHPVDITAKDWKMLSESSIESESEEDLPEFDLESRPELRSSTSRLSVVKRDHQKTASLSPRESSAEA